jgi:ATP-dependent DNA ligase
MSKETLPEFVPPMMAESANAPFDSAEWIFGIKLDGYRAITVFDGGRPFAGDNLPRLARR